jgi:glycogen operon protein
VDGFRFDLASVLSRNERGEPISDSPILWEIESDPVLAGTKLIAEAWDAAGLYQLGGFTGDRWAEWNGRFRDDVRRFLRGDNQTVRDFAWRMTGSFDIFRNKPSYRTHRSINYVTSHDGFTLADLVSYNVKHNYANGENNRDGMDVNYSWNHGVEGPTADPSIQRRRCQQMKNMIALLMLARGTPMVLGGDEMGRTQRGNNNAYCQDNEISWYDWTQADGSEMLRFTQGMIALRRDHATLRADHGLNGRPWQETLEADGISFHGVKLNHPDWSAFSHTLAIQYHETVDDVGFYVIVNAYTKTLQFRLPSETRWARLVDTSLPSPGDMLSEEAAEPIESRVYAAKAHSVVVLMQRT